MPFLTGFIVVEICSLIVPVGRRMRSGGGDGRAKLNRAAMGSGVVVCAIQSLAIAVAMERASTLDGFPLVPSPGWLFRLLTCVTLTAGAISVFYIAKLISWRGIANGFCILGGVDTFIQTYRYRQLLFFLGPLTKMRILVASKDINRARELIEWKSIQII